MFLPWVGFNFLLPMSSFTLNPLTLIRADAQKQQRLQLQQESGSASASSGSKTATALTDQEQRNTLKFGFSSKGTASKVSVGIKKPNIAKKKNVPISSIFGNDSDEE
ncbi:hypothetical protein Ahy_B06g080876 isoform E [Arachis hypogaea]|uniref:DUF4057 domain-containing protein n=1 Tax=Arachis hypogaea TaxID=3818 RepID=A0A444YJH2_ARAHY|nr:hypothetical protein Ahy_B06g080876 isoform E [Arachis hypogaea]